MRLIKNNKGSSIITVLIAMLLISALGATLLFTTYLGYQIKVSERSAKQNFYSAETAVNQIRDGVQQMVTDAIAAAYTRVLVEYNNPLPGDDGDDDTENKFKKFYYEALYSWEYAEDQRLFTAFYDPDYPGGYVPAALISFVPASEPVTVSGSGSVAFDGGHVVLQGVRISHLREGFETTITTDIVIGVPEFEYSRAEYAQDGIPEFALIAKESLTQLFGDSTLTLTGNAYAGRIDLQNNAHLTVDGGTVICGGTKSGIMEANGYLNIHGNLTMDGAALWARRIVVDAGSSLVMTESTRAVAYVSDDLELAGDGALATLVGRYYGFGNSETSAADSSAILINGHDTRLDLSELDLLMLAGHSFVNPGTAAAQGGDVLMGQSLSVKSDQLAYMVPAHCMAVGSNPYIHQGLPDKATLDGEIVWGSKTLSMLRDEGADVKSVTKKLGSGSSDTWITYFFFEFKNKSDANNYFRSYFQYNSDKIEQYLQIYSEFLDATNEPLSSGVTYDDWNRSSAHPNLNLVKEAGITGKTAISAIAASLKKQYANLRVTLSPSGRADLATVPGSGDKAYDPYDYLVNKNAVAALTGTVTTFAKDGKTTAAIVKGNYSVSEALDESEDIRVIVATGNVAVNRAFMGLIISGGTIYMQSNMTADRDLVAAALGAVSEDGKPLTDYLRADVDASGHADGDNKSTWAVDTLVSYANWKKD